MFPVQPSLWSTLGCTRLSYYVPSLRHSGFWSLCLGNLSMLTHSVDVIMSVSLDSTDPSYYILDFTHFTDVFLWFVYEVKVWSFLISFLLFSVCTYSSMWLFFSSQLRKVWDVCNFYRCTPYCRLLYVYHMTLQGQPEAIAGFCNLLVCL